MKLAVCCPPFGIYFVHWMEADESKIFLAWLNDRIISYDISLQPKGKGSVPPEKFISIKEIIISIPQEEYNLIMRKISAVNTHSVRSFCEA